jgi:hypothetical protein
VTAQDGHSSYRLFSPYSDQSCATTAGVCKCRRSAPRPAHLCRRRPLSIFAFRQNPSWFSPKANWLNTVPKGTTHSSPTAISATSFPPCGTPFRISKPRSRTPLHHVAA